MKRLIVIIGIVGLSAGTAFLIFDYWSPGKLVMSATFASRHSQSGKSREEKILAAHMRARSVKGVYMTSIVANDRGRAATTLRENIVTLLETTELNGVVIDVKETDNGPIITDQLRDLIRKLHQKNIWVIARQTVFKDSSEATRHPEWYLKRGSGRETDTAALPLWRDRRGGLWLDPASHDVWNYQVAVAKSAIDAGFDEVQFDYIRFPSDGDVSAIVYPVYNQLQPKYEVMRDFFSFLHHELTQYHPEVVLSADLFGYVALERADLGIGQRLEDVGGSFDYISLMVYPSHYYAGFQVAADPVRKLPALFYAYQPRDASQAAAAQPYNVVLRSLLIARDILDGRVATTSPSLVAHIETVEEGSVPAQATSENKTIARLRPWLQDFNLPVDSNRGIIYDAKMVRAQIDAAETAGASGWLLWNASNVYTRSALKEMKDDQGETPAS